jgi:hypothetical protein
MVYKVGGINRKDHLAATVFVPSLNRLKVQTIQMKLRGSIVRFRDGMALKVCRSRGVRTAT